MAQDDAVHIKNINGTPTMFDIHGVSLGPVGGGSGFAKLDGSNQPFTGALTIPEVHIPLDQNYLDFVFPTDQGNPQIEFFTSGPIGETGTQLYFGIFLIEDEGTKVQFTHTSETGNKNFLVSYNDQVNLGDTGQNVIVGLNTGAQVGFFGLLASQQAHLPDPAADAGALATWAASINNLLELFGLQATA